MSVHSTLPPPTRVCLDTAGGGTIQAVWQAVVTGHPTSGPATLVIQPQGGNVEMLAGSSAHLKVNGDINVTGDVLLSGADCAEDFDIAHPEGVDAGTVMVITRKVRCSQVDRRTTRESRGSFPVQAI